MVTNAPDYNILGVRWKGKDVNQVDIEVMTEEWYNGDC